MLSVDLHSHSIRSDGLLAPAELVARAAERGVRALALTDCADGIQEISRHWRPRVCSARVWEKF